MIELYNLILYRPVFNLLIFLYNSIPGHDIGLAIIALTVVVKLILLPFSFQAIRSQKAMQDIQPKLSDLKKRFQNDKEKLASETMKLYKEQKVNPLSSCLPLLIQFPFLIAVYQAFQTGLKSNNLEQLYSFIANPGHVEAMSFGIINLAASSWVLAVLAGLAQYFQTAMLSTKQPPLNVPGSRDESMTANVNKSMQYLMPIMTIFIGFQLPAGLTLYWLVTTLLTIVQQKFLFKKPATKTVEIIKK